MNFKKNISKIGYRLGFIFSNFFNWRSNGVIFIGLFASFASPNITLPIWGKFLELNLVFYIHHLHIFWSYWYTLNGEFVMLFVDVYKFHYAYLTFLSMFRWSNVGMWWSMQCLLYAYSCVMINVVLDFGILLSIIGQFKWPKYDLFMMFTCVHALLWHFGKYAFELDIIII